MFTLHLFCLRTFIMFFCGKNMWIYFLVMKGRNNMRKSWYLIEEKLINASASFQLLVMSMLSLVLFSFGSIAHQYIHFHSHFNFWDYRTLMMPLSSSEIFLLWVLNVYMVVSEVRTNYESRVNNVGWEVCTEGSNEACLKVYPATWSHFSMIADTIVLMNLAIF